MAQSKREKEAIQIKSIWNETALTNSIPALKEVHKTKMWKYLINHPNDTLDCIPYHSFGISPKIQTILLEEFCITTTKVIEVFPSIQNNTTKLLIQLFDGHHIEAVIIKHTHHSTLCVSSQIGCKMGCKFCATGTMGIIGNLTSCEILEQLFHAIKVAHIRNVVYMGMGEPLDNYEHVKSSVEMMINNRLYAISPRHVTISTVGVLKNMYKLTNDMPYVSLALSLHGPNQEVRLRIVPTASLNKFNDLMAAVDYHILHYKQKIHPSTLAARRKSNKEEKVASGIDTVDTIDTCVDVEKDIAIAEDNYSMSNINTKHNIVCGAMIEYILIRNINDRPEHAHELGCLLSTRKEGIYLNLIPYNVTEVAEDFESPLLDDIMTFSNILSKEYHIFTKVRHQMGDDVSGACGQLVVSKRLRMLQILKLKPKLRLILILLVRLMLTRVRYK